MIHVQHFMRSLGRHHLISGGGGRGLEKNEKSLVATKVRKKIVENVDRKKIVVEIDEKFVDQKNHLGHIINVSTKWLKLYCAILI